MLTIPADYRPASDLLRERIILITGAGSGIGACAARTFAAHGATVILLGNKSRPLEAVYDSIEQAGGPTPAILPLNLESRSEDDYRSVAHAIEKEFGRLDGLLHNAALLGPLTPIEHYNADTWHRVMQTNVNGPFLLTRACLPLLRKAGDASLLFTSDTVGRKGKAYWGAYGAAKFAVEGLMQILADELATNTAIRVNSIDPGPVLTALRQSAYPGADDSQLARPEDVMSTYLYLMGPDSKGQNGQMFCAQEAVLERV